MASVEIQGVVSAETTEPLVQFRFLDDEGEVVYGMQIPPMEARDLAGKMFEAASNAVYDAALITFAKGRGNIGMGIFLVDMVRKHRADHWGLPSTPEDWRTQPAEEKEHPEKDDTDTSGTT